MSWTWNNREVLLIGGAREVRLATMLLEWGSPGRPLDFPEKLLHVWSFYWAYLFDSSCFMCTYIYIYIQTYIQSFKVWSMIISHYVIRCVACRSRQACIMYIYIIIQWQIKLHCRLASPGQCGWLLRLIHFKHQIEMQRWPGRYWDVKKWLCFGGYHVHQLCELNLWLVGRILYHDWLTNIVCLTHQLLLSYETCHVAAERSQTLGATVPGSMNIGTIWQNV